MSYTTDQIRNVLLIGHGASGKTSLAESMLYVTGAIDRQGKVADGTTVCDYDAEEQKRTISISTAVAPVYYDDHKINIIDTPGFFDFAGDVMTALAAADFAIVVVTAKDGISVGTERAFKRLQGAGIPFMFYVSKIDEDNIDTMATINSIKERFGTKVVTITIPSSDGKGIVDVVHGKGFAWEGKSVKEFAPGAADAAAAEEFKEALMETAAGSSEELMDKYFENMSLEVPDIVSGIRLGVADGSIIPIFCGSAFTNDGTASVLRAIVKCAPSPLARPAVQPEEGEPVVCDPDGKTVGVVFKTVSDQFGKFSFVKVLSGKITSDMSLFNPRSGSTDKLGRLYTMCGKKNTEVKEIICGDIGAVGKMDWKTGDTVCDPKAGVVLAPIQIAKPCYSMAVSPKVKGQEDKIASGLARLNEEDISFTVENNPETHQMVLAGAGDIQLDVLCAKLKSRFGVEAELNPAKVAYRETIKGKVEAHGRHKKQSGGSGQFGDVWIRFEPQYETDDLVFAEEVFGGSVPKNFFPSVEKGLRNAVQKGVLAGYPLVGLKATLYDGSYHPVDSNDMAFQTAARLAYQEGIPNAKPTILEPIGTLKVTIPDANLGDIMSDISSKRRGTVLGMTAADGMQIVEAEVPMAEMSSYTIDLRSMTQGRGSFTLEFNRYQEAPQMVQQKVIADAKASEA